MEQQEIERDQKLWYSFLKNCKTDENCIRDAFNQRLTDIQDFNQVAEAPSEAGNTDLAAADEAGETDLGGDATTEAAQNSNPVKDTTTLEKTVQTNQPTQDPSIISRFTSWLFPNKDSGSNTGQAKDVATQRATPEKPVSDMETASSAQGKPAPTEVMPSQQTAGANMELPASGNEATKPDIATTSIAAASTKKVTAAKEFVPISPNKTIPKNSTPKADPGQAIADASKTATANSTAKIEQETKTADKTTSPPTLLGKIKNFFSSSDPASSPQSPEKDIAKVTSGSVADTEKETGSPDLADNAANTVNTDTSQQATTDDAATTAHSLSARTGQAKTASSTTHTPKTASIAKAKAKARKRALRKARLRRRQAKRRQALRRAANRKRASQKRKRVAAIKARKKQVAKRKKMAAAKKKAASKRRLQLARIQKLRNNLRTRNKRTKTAFALRSKNSKKTSRKVITNKKSASINYAFPAKSLQGSSRYVKNSCTTECSGKFKLEHHLRDYY